VPVDEREPLRQPRARQTRCGVAEREYRVERPRLRRITLCRGVSSHADLHGTEHRAHHRHRDGEDGERRDGNPGQPGGSPLGPAWLVDISPRERHPGQHEQHGGAGQRQDRSDRRVDRGQQADRNRATTKLNSSAAAS
jgi:hypothetical protein